MGIFRRGGNSTPGGAVTPHKGGSAAPAGPAPRTAVSEVGQMPIWEEFITLNSGVEPSFTLLGPAKAHLATDSRLSEWNDLDYEGALARDTCPIPETADREGYYGPHHFSYWASGLRDARLLAETAKQHGVLLEGYLDLGCASGRVLRHMALENPDMAAYGCDINRLHVEWCNANLPPQCIVFQNHSIPNLPLPDNALDLVSAYSVFTHIEALETAWLMELRRILRPGGLAWITVHTEQTLAEMNESWPLWKPTMDHPLAAQALDDKRSYAGDRLVLRWHHGRSYASNVFYKMDYLKSHWARFFEIIEIRRRFPEFQDVFILRKRVH